MTAGLLVAASAAQSAGDSETIVSRFLYRPIGLNPKESLV